MDYPSKDVDTAAFADYVALLRTNSAYTRLVLAEVLVLLGYYLSYIAVLSIITEFGSSNSGAMLLSVLALLESLPALLWCPVTGVIADRCVDTLCAF